MGTREEVAQEVLSLGFVLFRIDSFHLAAGLSLSVKDIRVTPVVRPAASSNPPRECYSALSVRHPTSDETSGGKVAWTLPVDHIIELGLIHLAGIRLGAHIGKRGSSLGKSRLWCALESLERSSW